ncbi:MAG: SH3 domain-containing protein [Victivallaceae bacterium]|nr:SH3 domain-containing protein [Victivallaceae bacterium]
MKKMMFALFSAAALTVAAADGVTGTVRPQKLNVRIQPVANAGVVAKLDRGSEVKIAAEEGAWYKIELPESAAAYMAAEYVKDGKTIAAVQLRYGPGIAFHSYGVVPIDTKVKVLDDKNPKWLKVAPPPGFFGYVSSQYVAVSDSDYKQLTGNKGGVAPSNRSAEEVKVVKPADPDEMSKRFEKMRGWFNTPPEDTTLKGEVLKSDNAASGASHMLVARDGEGKITSTVAVLYQGKVNWDKWNDAGVAVAMPENTVDLDKFVGKKAAVTGKKLVVTGWQIPYFVVEKVEEAK